MASCPQLISSALQKATGANAPRTMQQRLWLLRCAFDTMLDELNEKMAETAEHASGATSATNEQPVRRWPASVSLPPHFAPLWQVRSTPAQPRCVSQAPSFTKAAAVALAAGGGGGRSRRASTELADPRP